MHWFGRLGNAWWKGTNFIDFTEALLPDSEIETEKKIDSAAKTEFSKLFNGKFELGRASENKLVMSANDIGSFPIAVKVHRIDFDGGQFVNTTLMSDRRNLL